MDPAIQFMSIYDPNTMPWTRHTEFLVAKTIASGTWDRSDTVQRLTFLIAARTILFALSRESLLVKPLPADVEEIVDRTILDWGLGE